MENLKVIIIGAGISGLTCGIMLSRAGHHVEIYDQASELRPAGAGISLWSNGVKVFNQIGLGEALSNIGGIMNRMQYCSVKGDLYNNIPIQPLIEVVGQRPYPVARADLQQLLVDTFPGEVQLNSRCIQVAQDANSVTAYFENGHQTTGDVLLAADGVRSRLRQHVLGQEVQPRYGGYVNWNGLVAASEDLCPKETWMIYVGEHKRASMMPVGGDRFYFFFDVPMPREQVTPTTDIRSELTGYFAGWAEPVQNLIQRLDPEKTNRLLIHDVGPIPHMVRGRVALVGDSAHATCPDLGQGGCQAAEDAYVLSNYLTDLDTGIEAILQRYEDDRKDRTSAIVLKARKRSDQIHGLDPEVTRQWYEQLQTEKPEEVTGAIAKTILGGPLR